MVINTGLNTNDVIFVFYVESYPRVDFPYKEFSTVQGAAKYALKLSKQIQDVDFFVNFISNASFRNGETL